MPAKPRTSSRTASRPSITTASRRSAAAPRTRTVDRTIQAREPRRSSSHAHTPGIAHLDRIYDSVRLVAEMLFDLARDHVTPVDLPCVERVRHSVLGPSGSVGPTFEDVAVTAEALLRGIEHERGPLDPYIREVAASELVRFAHMNLSDQRRARTLRRRTALRPCAGTVRPDLYDLTPDVH